MSKMANLLSVLITIFIHFECVNSSKESSPNWVVSHPSHFHQSQMCDGGSEVKQMYDQQIKDWKISHITNNEVWYAMQLLFYGKSNGISIELGALGGTMATRCETEVLENFKWQRILVEANPTFRSSLSSLHKSFSVNAAICNSSQTLHYAMNEKDSYVNGIVEFMHPNFIKKFHPRLLNFQNSNNHSSYNWPSLLPSWLVEVPCVSMSTVLSTSGISHVNLWLLDTEGAELSILRTVDWSRVVFDVIIVETEVKNRSDEYANHVKDYLLARGYVLMALKRGRNSWYRHNSFVTATKAPILKNYMHFLTNVVYEETK